MLSWTSMIDDSPSFEHIAERREQRGDLRIRPLIEHPALRRAMGLDAAGDATLAVTSAGSTASTAQGPLPATRLTGWWPAAKTATKTSATKPTTTKSTAKKSTATKTGARRFDRRALLESEAA